MSQEWMSREQRETNPEVQQHRTPDDELRRTLEENKSDETTVAVTTQESFDGVREKAMRIATIDELEEGSGARRWFSPGVAANEKTKKAQELVRALVGPITKEGDTVVASDSKSKLWRDLSLKRALQHWNLKYVDVARGPGSALRVFTSSERLANHLNINEIGAVGKLVTKI